MTCIRPLLFDLGPGGFSCGDGSPTAVEQALTGLVINAGFVPPLHAGGDLDAQYDYANSLLNRWLTTEPKERP